MATKNIEIQDSTGNIYYPHTDAAIVKFGDSNVNATLSDMVYQTAGGSATAITLTIKGPLATGYPITFIASANNGGAATTINGKKLYKPGTTTSPNLIAGKAYTVWYNSISDCFFFKASAEGTALASDVRKNKTFSNDNDTGVVGGLDLSLLVSGNLRAGITIDGVNGKSTVVDTEDAVLDPNFLVQGYSGYDDGVKKSGQLTNLGNMQQAVDTWTDGGGTLTYRIPSKGAFTDVVNGYKPEVSKWDANFIASNIVNGKSIFGLAGSAEKSNFTYGTFDVTIPNPVTINLGFVPKLVIITRTGTTAIFGCIIVPLNISTTLSGFSYHLSISGTSFTFKDDSNNNGAKYTYTYTAA